MPEGTFAIASPDTRRPRQGAKTAKATKRPTKKPFNEAAFIAMCEDTAEAERRWYLMHKKIADLASGSIPPALDAEVAHLGTVAAEKFSALLTKQAKTPAALRAKAMTIIASYYDDPEDHCDLWALTKDAAALPSSIPIAASMTTSDREIIRLVNEFKNNEDKFSGLTAEEESYPRDHLKAQSASRKIRKLVDRGWEIRLRVAELPATTQEALAAKAWLTLWESTDGAVDSEPVSDAKRVPWSLAKDIVGGALANDLRDMAWPVTGAHVADADAVLVKLCADHIANHQAFNAYEGGLDACDNPLWQTYMDTYSALEDAHAKTFAGLVAKAQVIKVEARMKDGEDIPEEVASWMWGLVNDLLNLDPNVAKATVGITEIHNLALEMGRLDREAEEADNLFTDEGFASRSLLTDQIDKAACSIMKMKPQTLVDVMGKLMATIGGIDPMGAHLDDFPELREIAATVRTSIEDCLVALQEVTGQNLVDMGGSYFMIRRMQGLSR